MPPLSQVSLAAAILAAAWGSFVAMSPPHPSAAVASDSTSSSDLLRKLGLTRSYSAAVVLAPTLTLALYTAVNVLRFDPSRPSRLPGHAAANSINPDLLTWSPATAIPLALLLLGAIPLRLIAYAHLGRNFTFALAAPSGLQTGGVYAWVQHPAYTSFVTLVCTHLWLFCRTDGAQAALWSPAVYGGVRTVQKVVLLPVVLAGLVYVVQQRVAQEEVMLKGLFDKVWVEWHAKTARFIPGLF